MANTPAGTPVLPEPDKTSGAPKYPQLVQTVRRLEAEIIDLATRLEAVEQTAVELTPPTALEYVSADVCDLCGTTVPEAHFELMVDGHLQPCPNSPVEKTAA